MGWRQSNERASQITETSVSGKTPPDRRGCSADDGFETVEDSPPDTDWEVHINKSAKTSHKPVPGSSLAIRTSRRPSSASILEMRPPACAKRQCKRHTGVLFDTHHACGQPDKNAGRRDRPNRPIERIYTEINSPLSSMPRLTYGFRVQGADLPTPHFEEKTDGQL